MTSNRVSVDQEEYSALMSLKERYEDRAIRMAQVANRNHDLLMTCDAQARRLVEVDLMVQNYERINGMQRALIDAMRADRPQVASMEELSEFWRQWNVTTKNMVVSNPQQREEVSKLEPDLFRSWSSWIREVHKNKATTAANTRADVEARQPSSQSELQSNILASLREQNAMMSSRVRELEVELDAYKSRKKG